ncbi:ABC-type bacteriocin/lantibiotic exporter with double-glycine peptidase domain [Geomicrobium halophilum]|uniref:ABC-type bacteriocin/lantibiotic exporter with double-glycine peptidase domain n=1 Tax=Geomicrobium halophilum TaxID=549000 RepID=A0A841PR93_9BACL|nr:hypothetical protein [Geomicrobium halophilum]MBB6451310.1 ABC-type bacteriocin/lantibiotic exporter with double-glycine peptidase domain [Geomicrobium halophilum]
MALVKALLTSIMMLVISFFIVYLSGLSFTTALIVYVFITPILLITLSIGTIIAAYSNNKIEVNLWKHQSSLFLFPWK